MSVSRRLPQTFGKKMKTLVASALILPFILASCGTIYSLPGHNGSNENHPPDVTMVLGEKRRIVAAGFERFGIAMPPYLFVEVEDPNVVSVEGEGWTGYLVPKSTGTTRVRYNKNDTSSENVGFEVTVKKESRTR